jgi:hypothetical protein
MFKNIERGFSKFFTNERIIILVIFLILSWGLITYSGAKGLTVDSMTGSNYSQSAGTSSSDFAPHTEIDSGSATVGYSEPMDNLQSTPVSEAAANVNPALTPVANPSDLLPKDQNSQWAALNPNTMNQGDVLMPDLLQAGYHIGLDTIGQTLRNANLQLRSDPVIAKQNIGPWNQSTIEPDLGRVPLELGQGSQ